MWSGPFLRTERGANVAPLSVCTHISSLYPCFSTTLVGYIQPMPMNPAMNNPPQAPMERLRLIVKARRELPKKFIWEIIQEDGTGRTSVVQSSPNPYDTMETAYDHGRPVLTALRARAART